jgi:large subunit ribosomal protein L28
MLAVPLARLRSRAVPGTRGPVPQPTIYSAANPERLDCPRMAKICHSCGKGPAFGQSRSHSMVATKRRFDPNLQKVRILVGKAPRRVYVCTRCLKAGKVTKAV